MDFPPEVNTQGPGKSLAPSLPSSLLEILPYFSLETQAEQAKPQGAPAWAGKFQSELNPAQQAGRWLAAPKDFSKLKLSSTERLLNLFQAPEFDIELLIKKWI